MASLSPRTQAASAIGALVIAASIGVVVLFGHSSFTPPSLASLLPQSVTAGLFLHVTTAEQARLAQIVPQLQSLPLTAQPQDIALISVTGGMVEPVTLTRTTDGAALSFVPGGRAQQVIAAASGEPTMLSDLLLGVLTPPQADKAPWAFIRAPHAALPQGTFSVTLLPDRTVVRMLSQKTHPTLLLWQPILAMDHPSIVLHTASARATQDTLHMLLGNDASISAGSWLSAQASAALGRSVPQPVQRTLLSQEWTLELEGDHLLLGGTGNHDALQQSLTAMQEAFTLAHPALTHEKRTFDNRFTSDYVAQADPAPVEHLTKNGWEISMLKAGSSALLTALNGTRFAMSNDAVSLNRFITADPQQLPPGEQQLFGLALVDPGQLPHALQALLAHLGAPGGRQQWNLTQEGGRFALTILKLP